ncbi:insulinase family protein [Kocuria rhizophila]|uniref:M16 family metallopeptidase n=1 Tax=Kocuria TaxID=57493 RepID=UPI000C7B2DC9|nr:MULTISPECIES: pitrilysin family protein [Kocuria]MCR4526583.1 insulinase family protein [Kocuria rhizophila]MCT1546485.1 insulinase family protein [Kocuria rhizophila]MCT2172180.1 insulinase family protein [Kocuria rhizophila]MDA4829128.1 pitrilysin family protein [Kocuria rhizophila]MDN3462251.1 pitrilysin family protein [Kocuria sp. APC 4018]
MTVVHLPLKAGGPEEHGSPEDARLRAYPDTDPARGFTHTVHDDADGAVIMRTVLPCGTRVLTEKMPGQRSVSVGFWVSLGSRDEAPGMLGSTHFLEHLLFKGTARRSSLEIAEAFDRVGGESNAFTSHEHTCYHARVLSEALPMAVDVLADMFTGAVLDPEEFDRERGVILEEIAMDRDDPTDFAFEQFTEQVFHGSPLARPIAGTPEEIRSVARDAVWEHYRGAYRPENLVVTVAGGLEHENVVQLVRESLARAGWDPDTAGGAGARRPTTPALLTPLTGTRALNRPVEQANVVLGGAGLQSGDERRFTMTVLNAALGGGMSSRLFHTIREQKGLAYSTFSFSGSYSDAGFFGMYAGCTADRVDRVTGLMRDELDRLAQDGMDAAELAKVEGQLSGATVLALEDTGSRMSRLGSAELKTGVFMDLDESLRRIRAVTSQDVQQLAADLGADATVRTVVGPGVAREPQE